VLKIYLSTSRLSGDYTLKSCFPDRLASVTPDKRGLNRSGQFFEGVLGQGKRAELSAEQRTEVWSRWERGGRCTRWGAHRHQPMPLPQQSSRISILRVSIEFLCLSITEGAVGRCTGALRKTQQRVLRKKTGTSM
jgi:hypothetical protein